MHPLKIIVNGKAIETSLSEVHYADVVAFAGKSGNPSVTYRARLGGDLTKSGMMHEGCEPVALVASMVFNVMHTGNA